MTPRVFQRNRRWDRLARWLISVGGVGVIGCVAVMLLLIVWMALPLFGKPHATEVVPAFTAPAGTPILAVGLDDNAEVGFTLGGDGFFQFLELRTGAVTARVPASPRAGKPGVKLTGVSAGRHLEYALAWDDGSWSLVRIAFRSSFETGRRQILHQVEILAEMPAAVTMPAGGAGQMRAGEKGGAVLVWLDPSGATFQVRRSVVKTDLLGNEETAMATYEIPVPAGSVTAFTVDLAGSTLYAGTADARLLRWNLGDDRAELLEQVRAFEDGRRITALGLVFGDVSLAVGDDRGGVSTWMPVALYGEGSSRRMELIHTLAAHASPVVEFPFVQSGKQLLSRSAAGLVRLDHMTSERKLLTLQGSQSLDAINISNRGDHLLALDRNGLLHLWDLDAPHAEISWKVLFGKVWYENYDRPALVWQSSAANDDAEPKFSFVPLIFGSLKATFYALFFAVPLALMGAIYTSQFTTPEVRGVVKPAVEIMAAVPSVVIGFLAALWLAPRVETAITGVFLFALILPVAFLLTLALWMAIRNTRLAKRVGRGFEFLPLIPVLILAGAAALALGPAVEKLLFAGDFKLWLFHTAGLRYDQRNSLIIAFALGFAVVPVIFTMAEDALSNVPNNLKAASLALGASRWQTVWRVILPSASPGVFAAVIIGFGRAVGETMIVLMATGNTPILDASPFNGMRTLSANIAVEIPEAPAGGTLFRLLFLSAVLLFLLTSVLNTAAELIRHRLRKKYGQF